MSNHVIARSLRYAHIVIYELTSDYGVEKSEAAKLVVKDKWSRLIAERASLAKGVNDVSDIIAEAEGYMDELYEE